MRRAFRRLNLEACAVLNRAFSYDLLQAVQLMEAERLQRHLHSLADAEWLYAQGLAPSAAYRFKHDLIRDAVYLATPVDRRRELHRQAAVALSENFLAIASAEVLARHWSEAGEAESAIEQWMKPAKAAEARKAFPEALESYRQALLLLMPMPETPERAVRELKLRQSIMWMLIFVKGNAAPETVEAAKRAIALAERCGKSSHMVHLVIARGHSALNAGDLSTAAAIADRAVELALRERGIGNLGNVYLLQIVTRHLRGDLAGVEGYFADGLTYFDDPRLRPFLGVAVPAVGCAALNAWMLGRADTACDAKQ